jgi:peptidyl-prolyl cis-trans isomerase SurA
MTRWGQIGALCVALGALVIVDGAGAAADTRPAPRAATAAKTAKPAPAAAAAAEIPAVPEVVDRIVATIDGEPVTWVELQTYSEQMRQHGGPDAPTTDRGMLDELVLEKIVHKQIEAQGVAASDQQIDAYIASIKQRNKLDDEQLKAALTAQGLTWEQYRTQVRTDIERAALINKEIRTKVNVPPEEVERYYKEHISEYGAPEKAHVRLISLLLPDGATDEQKATLRAEAEQIRKDAAGGKDFAALAKEHSQGPGAADGGDIGEVTSGSMQPEFDKAVFALKPGAVSEVIVTDSGFHIFKLETLSGEGHQPLSEVSNDIKEKLYRQSMESRYDRWLKEDLRAKYNVEILL